MTILTTAQIYERIGPTAIMATDAMATLSFRALCDVVEALVRSNCAYLAVVAQETAKEARQ